MLEWTGVGRRIQWGALSQGGETTKKAEEITSAFVTLKNFSRNLPEENLLHIVQIGNKLRKISSINSVIISIPNRVNRCIIGNVSASEWTHKNDLVQKMFNRHSCSLNNLEALSLRINQFFWRTTEVGKIRYILFFTKIQAKKFSLSKLWVKNIPVKSLKYLFAAVCVIF